MGVAVVRFPGSNCETETVRACQETIADSRVELVDHLRDDLASFDAVILPGGFSYGDYLRAGAIAARAPISGAIERFAASGKPVLGICNGFQQLQELGLLPGALMRNRSLRFFCGTVHLRAEGKPSAATCALDRDAIYDLPVAHGEGCFWADDDELARLEEAGQVVFRYVDSAGELADDANPNGSCGAIAGIANERGNVVGLMPHPERNADALAGNGCGREVFRSLATFCAGGAVTTAVCAGGTA
ncbi:MAG: phosphoribosylformylglycinamidine synthase I [Acidobacteriota bacterium]